MTSLDDEMKARITAEKARLSGERGEPEQQDFDDTKERTVDELRTILKRFRRAMATKEYPGTLRVEAPVRHGWIIASGTVEDYGDTVFHLFLLNTGAIYYLSGDPTPPFELTGKWHLGDSIPALEAKIPAGLARLMAEHDVEWPETQVL